MGTPTLDVATCERLALAVKTCRDCLEKVTNSKPWERIRQVIDDGLDDDESVVNRLPFVHLWRAEQEVHRGFLALECALNDVEELTKVELKLAPVS